MRAQTSGEAPTDVWKSGESPMGCQPTALPPRCPLPLSIFMEDPSILAPASDWEGEDGRRLILESIQDFAVFTLDPAGLVRTWNPGAEKLFGWSAAEMAGRSSRVLWTPEDQAAGGPEQEVATVQAKGRADEAGWRVRKDGSRLFVEGVTRPLRDAAGALRGFTKVCRDATQTHERARRLAEHRARGSAVAEQERARLAELFHRSPSFHAVLHGPEHVIERTNERYLQLIGRREEEVRGRTVADALPEVVSQGYIDLLDRVYATGEPFISHDNRVFLRRLEGELDERVVDFVYLPLREADNRVSGIFVHGIDLTERVRAERESHRLSHLVEQQTRTFDATLSHIKDCVYTFDLQHRLTYVNRALLDLWGRTLEEVVGKRLAELDYPPEAAAAVDAELRAVILTNQPTRGNTTVRSAAGETRSLEHIFTPVFNEAHAVVAVAGTSRDVTEQRRALEALRASQQRFDLTVEGAKLGTFHWDLDGTDLNWNARMREFFWLPPDRQVVLSTIQARMHPEDRPRVSAALERAVRGEQRYDEEYRVLGPGGEVRWLHVIGEASRNPEGKLDHFTGLAMDISRQKFAELEREALLDAERAARSDAERASRMKDEFLATLSHELRTPLNAMLGWARLLHEGPNTPEDLEMGLGIIERNARAQKQIIEDLLDMSRIISGKVRLDVQRLDLKPVVEAAIETVRAAAAAKGIRLQAVLDPTARPVSGDPNRLQQIFWNLLSNAIKFTPKAGRVQVILERVNSHLEVSVIDNGPGIAPEFLPFLFDRFRQADSSITRQHGGLGLGLAIVKQLVELHGGNVRVRSGGAETGSTFVVSLPLTVMHTETIPGPMVGTAHTVEKERRHPQASGGGPAPVLLPGERPDLRDVKVVVVDDEADARALVTRLLEDCGARVSAAGSAEEAFSLVQEKRPAVLVSDIGMPGMDGYTLIRKVRTLGPEHGGGTPAVALTAYARSEDRMRAVMAGFQMHVAKPVEAAELLTMVASLAGRMKG